MRDQQGQHAAGAREQRAVGEGQGRYAPAARAQLQAQRNLAPPTRDVNRQQ